MSQFKFFAIERGALECEYHLIGASQLRERRPTDDELDKLRSHFDKQRWRMKIPMRCIMDFAILTARREGEITRRYKLQHLLQFVSLCAILFHCALGHEITVERSVLHPRS